MDPTAVIAQGVIDFLSILLIVRLQLLHLRGAYRALKTYLLFGLLESAIWFVNPSSRGPFDYRVVWIILKAVDWVLTLWIVYAVLSGVLRNLPGVLRFSRKLLNTTFLIAIIASLWTARAEYTASVGAAAPVTKLGHLVAITFVVNRAVCTAELVIILAILVFVLWFPVQIAKNLAVLVVGLVIYFSSTTVSWLAWSFWSTGGPRSVHAIDDIVAFVLALCLAYWTVFISNAGESVPVRIGHSWQAREQERLMVQLETMNASLLRAARR